jgi:hypothetical protein
MLVQVAIHRLVLFFWHAALSLAERGNAIEHSKPERERQVGYACLLMSSRTERALGGNCVFIVQR